MKNFDELLDGVLREDVLAEPRVGLERRVMARVRADGQRRPALRFVAYATGAAALSVCIVALLIWPKNRPPVQHVGGAPAISASVLPEKADLEPARNEKPKTVQVKSSILLESGMVARVDKTLPKLDVFPSSAPVDMFPRPVTTNERGRQLTELRSKKVGEALMALHQEQNEPIQIAAIEITPLQ